MKHLKPLKHRGDTIVEVLIVLAILGLAFAISSATASRGISQSRNAQEHSQGLGVLNTQIEYLRNAIKEELDNSTLPAAFCFDYTSGNPVVTPIATPDDYASYPPACKSGSLYTVRISFVSMTPESGYYDVRVNWDGVSSLGPQQEQMFYRVHQLSLVDNTDIGLGSEAAKIHVTAKRIQPNVPYTTNGADPGPDPSPPSICNNASSYTQVNKAGPIITLTGGGQSPQISPNISDTGYTFDNLREFSTYTASIAYGSISSASFELCSPTSKIVQATGGVKNIDFVMRPICYKEDYTDSYIAYGQPYYHTVTPVYRQETTYWWGDGPRRGDLDGYWTYRGSEWWSPNSTSTGYHYKWYSNSNIYPGYSWYNVWEWHLYSSTATVFDHNEYSDYRGDAYTATASGQRWHCPT
jgi:type II secretory pathway pseudopilin PulG